MTEFKVLGERSLKNSYYCFICKYTTKVQLNSLWCDVWKLFSDNLKKCSTGVKHINQYKEVISLYTVFYSIWKVTRQQEFYCSTVLLRLFFILPIRILSFCLSVSVWNPLLVFIKACSVSGIQSYCQFPPVPMQWLQLPSLNNWQFKGPNMTGSLCSSSRLGHTLDKTVIWDITKNVFLIVTELISWNPGREWHFIVAYTMQTYLLSEISFAVRRKSPHSYKADTF